MTVDPRAVAHSGTNVPSARIVQRHLFVPVGKGHHLEAPFYAMARTEVRTKHVIRGTDTVLTRRVGQPNITLETGAV